MFRLLSLKIYKHPLLAGKTFELCNPEENNTLNYYSIIIGPNGSGKSKFLGFILEVFNELALFRDDEKYKIKGRFIVTYKLNRDIFTIVSESRQAVCLKNGEPIHSKKLNLPDKWLASSVTINDKYPILNYLRKLKIPEYKYLGIRSATNNAFISRITTNTVLYFVDALKKDKSAKLLEVYKSLSLSSEVEIVFIGGPGLKFEKKNGQYVVPQNKEDLIAPFRTFLKKNKSKTSYRLDNYSKHINENIEISKIFDFIKQNSSLFTKPSKAAIQLKYKIDLKNNNGIQKLINDWSLLSIMLDLELLKIGKFLITKDIAFRYEETSSGESHLLTSLHGILANLEDNSLVIIDEPEVSLHPNWQIDYLEILKIIINSYKGVNVVISTHSHLLVSSLKNDESRIITIKRNTKKRALEVEELDFETYGWDPESVLYNVFHVVNTRNKYFERDLRELISLISKRSDDLERIGTLTQKLEVYINPNGEDPLRLVIDQAKNYINDKNGVSKSDK